MGRSVAIFYSLCLNCKKASEKNTDVLRISLFTIRNTSVFFGRNGAMGQWYKSVKSLQVDGWVIEISLFLSRLLCHEQILCY